MKDLSSELNIPFVMNKDGDGKDLVAKTVMRKKNFSTPDRQLPVESVTEDDSENEATKLVTRAIAYLRDRHDSLDTVAIMKKGDMYAANDTNSPGFQQKLNSGWTVVAYVERRGTSIRTDGPHNYLKQTMTEADVEDAVPNTTNKQFVNSLRADGWSIYTSRMDHRERNTNRIEFEKDGVEFEIIGKQDTWELYIDGATLSGRGSMHDSLQDAFNASQENVQEDLDEPPFETKTYTPEEIADHHEVNLSMIDHELRKGMAVEMEHTNDMQVAMEITLDHLYEMPNYYSKLSDMEGNLSEMVQQGAWECEQMRAELDERVMDPREAILRKALQYLDNMIKAKGDQQAVGGYAFDIARAFNLKDIITARELAQLYNDWQAD
jgi:hypothetical protein